ncbi:hypothetical protein ABK040_004690 [Willaertia magna]
MPTDNNTVFEEVIESLIRNVENIKNERDFTLNNSLNNNYQQNNKFSPSFDNLIEKGYYFYNYLWNTVLDQRIYLGKENDNRFKLRKGNQQFLQEGHEQEDIILTLPSQTTNTTTKNKETIPTRKDVIKRYDLPILENTKTLSRKKSNKKKKLEEQYRLLYLPQNLNPIDYYDGERTFFNKLLNVLSHKCINEESLIEKEISLNYPNKKDYAQDLYKRYLEEKNNRKEEEQKDLTIEEFSEMERQRLLERAKERQKKELHSIQFLSNNSSLLVNPQLDYLKQGIINNSHLLDDNNQLHYLQHKINRQYEFSKQVMKVFESKKDKKLFQDNPMGIPFIEPSIEPYHPLAFNHIVIEKPSIKEIKKKKINEETTLEEGNAQLTQAMTDRRKPKPIPILPQRQRRSNRNFFTNDYFQY